MARMRVTKRVAANIARAIAIGFLAGASISDDLRDTWRVAIFGLSFVVILEVTEWRVKQ